MGTVASTHIKDAANQWKAAYPSAIISGIVPDSAHLSDGGYHVSLEDLKRFGNLGDYSSANTLDKQPAVKTLNLAAAIDMNLNKSDMTKLYKRVEAVYNDRSDPRRKYVNAINVWNGVSGVSPRRFNFQRNTVTNASKDHEWHSHADVVRALWDEAAVGTAGVKEAVKAFLSIVTGQSKADYLGGGATAAGTGELTVEAFEYKPDGQNTVGNLILGTNVAAYATRDAVNGLADEARKTNELLSQLVQLLQAPTTTAKEAAREGVTAALEGVTLKVVSPETPTEHSQG